MKSARATVISLLALSLSCAVNSGQSSTYGTTGAGAGGSAGNGTDAAVGGSGGVGGVGGNDGGVISTGGTGASAAGAGGGTCTSDPNEDKDQDGWSVAQGDCNDCDANVNPGAIDVLHPAEDGGAPTWGDEDCDGTPGDSVTTCDQGLQLADVNPMDAAKAIELCQTASASDRKFGLLSAAYVRADGTPFANPGLQVGIQSAFGPNVKVQAGANMLVLSSGHARTIGQPGACGTLTCKINATGTAPPGFPQANPLCPPVSNICDDVALEVKLRAPSNATGYSFNFKFYSFEFPESVCDKYNDQFIALVSPPPTGSINGNISFDSTGTPVSVDMGFFDVCDPSTASVFGYRCSKAGTYCPPLPNPYCPLGPAELKDTGFDVWKQLSGMPVTAAGATRWLTSQAPVKGGDEVTIRFAIWDTGNQQFDSTAIIDNFQWLAEAGSVAVSTEPVQNPK